MPNTIFTNPAKHPSENDLKKRIGQSYQLIEKTILSLQSVYTDISSEWKFSKTSGWYVTYNRKKKRLFYLFPIDGGFKYRMVLGDNALLQINREAFPDWVIDMAQQAKKYPEGTLLEFHSNNFDVEVTTKLIKIKCS